MFYLMIKIFFLLLLLPCISFGKTTPHYYESKDWLDLLYYEHHSSGYKSIATSQSFFVHKNGQSSPKDEYIASLALTRKHDNWFRRTFPLRYKRLCKNHNINYNPIIKLDSKINAVQLVYPSRYLRNPASMFGHLFLIFKSKNGVQDSHIFHYIAKLTPTSQLGYIYNGLTGKFQGRFLKEPYYKKIKDYTYVEDRDIIYYNLLLSQEMIENLQLHAIELNQTSFNYYFLNQNCAFFIAKSLNVILENDIQLQKLFIYPTQIVNDLINKNKISSQQFRSSSTSIFNNRYKQLSHYQKKQLSSLLIEKKNNFDLFDSNTLTTFLYVSEYAINNNSHLVDIIRHNRIKAYQKITIYNKARIRSSLEKSGKANHIKSKKISLSYTQNNGIFASYSPLFYDNKLDKINTNRLNALSFRLGATGINHVQGDMTLINIKKNIPFNPILGNYSWELNSFFGINQQLITNQELNIGLTLPILNQHWYMFVGGNVTNYNQLNDTNQANTSLYPAIGIHCYGIASKSIRYQLGYEYRYNSTYINPKLHIDINDVIVELNAISNHSETILKTGLIKRF